ncbi:MAG: hypothetical protein GX445_03320 [Elusimicrobia bacterium]|nr:hypothetical protein [Elusimicrobiota bacterium]
MPLIIQKGSVFVFNVFDIGWEINLSRAESLLIEKQKSSLRFKFSKDPRKAIIIKEAPLGIDITSELINILNKKYRYTAFAKIWDYGTLSVTIQLCLDENTSWDELIKIADYLEKTSDIELIARGIKDEIKNIILPAIRLPMEWDKFEDYIIYFFENIDGISNPKEIFDRADIPSLILGEFSNKLSTIASIPVTENYIQYYDNDIAIIDWDAAIIIEPDGSRDICDAIEFSLTHLLELRYYDYLIDNKLDILYDSVKAQRKGLNLKRLINLKYDNIAEDAVKNYIEFSDLIGKIENSFKTVGDPYIATVFRTCAEQFRFGDWNNSISRKMKTLFEITQIIQAELNAMRSHMLEIIVIILIAIEIVPLLLH